MMIYLERFVLPTEDMEWNFAMKAGRIQRVYSSYYPFQVLTRVGDFSFEPVTVLCGSNGSGKTTLLNVMAEKLRAERDTLYNRSSFFEEYTDLCEMKLIRRPKKIRIITSDDVFDFMLNLRSLNEGIDSHRKTIFEDYLERKNYKSDHGESFRLRSLDDYEELKKHNRAKSQTQSRYTRETLGMNVREHSNGESAYSYFSDKIEDEGLYLLDEPENSLSPKRQLELAGYLTDAARFFSTQLIIATHSPFLMAMKDARIYDLDERPAQIKRWTQIDNVRTYHDFFLQHDTEFRADSAT